MSGAPNSAGLLLELTVVVVAALFTVMVKVCAGLVSAPPALSFSMTVTMAVPSTLDGA